MLRLIFTAELNVIYVILKKINNVWYATKNRYTAKELEVIVDKHYSDVVDFESINDGDYQGLDDGVIIVKDDGRELDKNGKYLNDDLKLETNVDTYLIIALWCLVAWLLNWEIATCLMLIYPIIYIVKKMSVKETVQDTLKADHKAKGMM